MKKLIVFGIVLGGLAAMTSCKKDYSCTYGGDKVPYNNLKKDQAETAEAGCKSIGGTWAAE